MGLDAGEVQARLTARDEMSATITQVTERIKVLQSQIEALGGVTGPTLQMLQQNLQGAQMKLVETQAAMQLVNNELGDMSVKAAESNTHLNEMDRLTTRMVERLAIFYALKASFDFVKGLFEADEAMVTLSASTDLSLGKIQQLSYIADQANVPFKSLTASLDQFDKRLADLKPLTVDTLKGIGVDPSKLFGESSDDRVTSVIQAIAQLPTQLQRTRAEFALFGNDAIDPMIQKFESLKKAADESIRPDAQLQSMAQTVQMYRNFASDLGEIAAGIIAKGQEAVNSIFAPAFMSQGDPSAKKYQNRQMSAAMIGLVSGNPLDVLGALAGDFDAPDKMGDVQIPASGKGGQGGGNTPLMGDAYVASLKAQSLEVNKLSDAQLVQLDRLRAMNQLTADNAARMDISTTQFKEFTAAVRLADEDWKKVTADFDRFDGENYKLSSAVQAQISIMKLQGKTAREMADDLDIPIQAIVKFERQWAMSLQRMDREGKEFMRELQVNVNVIAKAINDAAGATGAPGALQPTATGNAAFDAAANKRNAANDAASARFSTRLGGPLGDEATAANQTAAMADMMKAEKDFTDSTVAAARANRDAAEAAKTAADADRRKAQDAFNATMMMPDATSPFSAGWRPGDWQPGGTIQLPSHADGGPTKAGPALLHDDEYVVPSKGALVMSRPGGGGDTYHITVPLQGLAVTTDPGGLAIIEQTVIKAVSSVMRQARRYPNA